MTDLALLGVEFASSGADKVNRELDDFADKSGKAAGAADHFEKSNRDAAGGAHQLKTAVDGADNSLDDFVGSLLKTTGEEVKMAKATRDASKEARDLAKAKRDAAEATDLMGKRARDGADANGRMGKSARDAGRAVGDMAKDLANGGISMESLGRHAMNLISVLPRIAGVAGVAAAAMVALWDQVERAKQGQAEINALVAGVGAAAGVTADAIEQAAITGARAQQIAVSAARDQAVEYTRTGQIGSEILVGLMGLTKQYADATGQDAAGAVKELGAAFADPSKGAQELAGTLGILNAAQLENIQRLEAQGSHLAAQRQLLAALDKSLDTTAVHVGGLAGAWNVVRNAALNALDAMKRAATGGTLSQQLGAAQSRLAEYKNLPGGAFTQRLYAGRIERDTKLVAELTGKINALNAAQQQRARNRESVAAAAAIDDALPKETALTRIQDQRVKIQNALNKGLVDGAKAQRALNALDKQAADLQKVKETKAKSGGGAKTPKAPAPVRDMSQEYDARLDQMLAQAKSDELQAQLGLARDAKKRAEIQKQILDADLAARQAQVDRTLAEINDPLNDKLTAAKKQELTAQLNAVKATQQAATAKRAQAIDEDLARSQAKDRLELDMAERDARLELLKVQQAGAKTEGQRYEFALKILAEQQAQETARLEAMTDLRYYTEQEAALARARLKLLPQRYEAERQQLKDQRDLFETYRTTVGHVRAFGEAFKEHDWVGALESLIEVIKQLKNAFGEAGTLGDKIQGIGGLIAGLGGLVGGKAGRALQGAGSGAVAGFQLGGMFGLGPLGAIAGGLFGGLSSLFGGNKQKRAERRAKEQQEAEEKARKAQEVAQEKRDLELRLIEATGDKVRILAAQRAKELMEVDASNRALLERVHAAEDQLARFEKVRDIEIEAARLAGNEIGALTLERQRELEAIDATLRPLQQLVYNVQDATTALDKARQILQTSYDAELTRLQDAVASAHDQLSEAYDRESSALQDVISRTRQTAQELRDFRRSLDMDTTGLSPENAYNAAKATYTDVRNRALLGDKDAQAQYVDVANAFKQASLDFFGPSENYLKDLAGIKTSTEWAANTADRTADRAEQQLEQLKLLVSGYLDVNESTVSVRDAIANLESAQQALDNTQRIVEPLLGINQGVVGLTEAIAGYQAAQAAQAGAIQALAQAVAQARADPNNQPAPANDIATNPGYTSTNGDYAAYVRGNADLMALFQAQKGMARGRSIEEFGLYHWANFGMNEPNRTVRAFRDGGAFMVGGAGGTDGQRVEFDASPDERVTVETPAQMRQANDAAQRTTALLSKVSEQLDVLIIEARADKRQRAAGNKLLTEGLQAVQASFERGSKRVGKAA